MRMFYKSADNQYWECVVSVGEGSESSTRAELSDINSLVEEGKAVLYENRSALQVDISYQYARKTEYPSIGDQLDQIFHEGIDAWKETIQAVKDAHPKPE